MHLYCRKVLIQQHAKGLLPEWLRFAQGWYLFVFGVAVILLMLWLPDGLLSLPERIQARRMARQEAAARTMTAQTGA